MAELGLRIRSERKALGLSLKELAERAGISTMTLQRIETGKTSPSVSVLAEIASHLRQSVVYFIEESNPKFLIVKAEEQQVIHSSGMRLKVIAAKGVIDENVLVNLGEANREGTFIDSHVEDGRSFAYMLEGTAIIEHDGIEYLLNEGDAIYYDARYPHSVRSLGKTHKWLSIFFKGKT